MHFYMCSHWNTLIWEYRYIYIYIDRSNSNSPNSNNKFRYIPMNLYIPYIYTIWVWWKTSHDLKSNSPNLPKLNGFGQVSWRNPWSSACFRPLGPLPPRPLVVASQGRSGCSLRRLDWTGRQGGSLGRKWVPSGEPTNSNGKSPFLMGTSTISMAIFHCYVSSPEGKQKGKNGPKWGFPSRKHDGFSAANKFVGPNMLDHWNSDNFSREFSIQKSSAVCGYPILTNLISIRDHALKFLYGTPLLKLPSGKLTFRELEYHNISWVNQGFLYGHGFNNKASPCWDTSKPRLAFQEHNRTNPPCFFCVGFGDDTCWLYIII